MQSSHSLAQTLFQQTCHGFATRTLTPFPVTGSLMMSRDMRCQILIGDSNFLLQALQAHFPKSSQQSSKVFYSRNALQEMVLSAVSGHSMDIDTLSSKTQPIWRNSGKVARIPHWNRRCHQKTSEKYRNNWESELETQMSSTLSFNKHLKNLVF